MRRAVRAGVRELRRRTPHRHACAHGCAPAEIFLLSPYILRRDGPLFSAPRQHRSLSSFPRRVLKGGKRT
jgi:hypothetical protein